jgi:nuclear pore complex protein Nup160
MNFQLRVRVGEVSVGDPMSDSFLVETQLSSLFPPHQVTAISLKTSRRNTPLPPQPKPSDPPAEHALCSSLLYTQYTGQILIRIIHGGLVLELIPFNSGVSPIRFVFPSPVLTSPGIFVWQESELHVIAVTKAGSLYRLVLPIGRDGKVWLEPSGANWCREYLIKSIRESLDGLVQVQGPHCIAIGLPNGSLLRIEADSLGDQSRDGRSMAIESWYCKH